MITKVIPGEKMRTEIQLRQIAAGHMLGIRATAAPIRHRVESAISDGNEVVLNFNGVEATQSFVDEVIGALILRRGPSVLDRLVFQGCSDTVRAIVRFVAADRADQFAKRALSVH